MKIEIDAETESRICAQSILDALGYMYEDIMMLAELENTQDFQSEDLEHNIRDLEALKIAYRYYCVFDEWYKIDDYTLAYINEDGEAVLSDLDESLLTEREELDAAISLMGGVEYKVEVSLVDSGDTEQLELELELDADEVSEKLLKEALGEPKITKMVPVVSSDLSIDESSL